MANRTFSMRLNCMYEDPDNAISKLDVEVLTGDGWQPLELSFTSPGFLLFVFSLFNCQHKYFHVNCAERGIMLNNAEAKLLLTTNRDWDIESIELEILGNLKSGVASEEDIEYITGRMELCPVSKNIRQIENNQTVIAFTQA